MRSKAASTTRWGNKVRAGAHEFDDPEAPDEDEIGRHRKRIEPWLAALLQAEHLNLLVGSGLTTAVAHHTNAPQIDMALNGFEGEHAAAVLAAAATSATSSGRGNANIEDAIRTVHELLQGLAVLSTEELDDGFSKKAKALYEEWSEILARKLVSFLGQVLEAEAGIRSGLEGDTARAQRARRLLGAFLLTFASRTVTRDRLHIFTTNYDRLVEFGSDLLGLRVIDRFVGNLEPVFRASRLGIDMHYNPPGIRGEPRYLEGVIRLTKLHGSIDWRQVDESGENDRIVRTTLPFGAARDHSEVPKNIADGLMIYPIPAKDVETLEYPYAELFRDFAAAVCQPNAVLVTYGYGFGDDHINRILRDMLTIPSTHLAILSFDDAGGRIPTFCDRVGRDEQITLLIGPHFGDLAMLVDHYLPKPAIDSTTWRMVELLNRRLPRESIDASKEAQAAPTDPLI